MTAALTLEQQKANRKLWVEALRSGKYEQGRKNLLLEGRYCCLGVLASLAGYSDEYLDNRGTLGGLTDATNFVGLRGSMGGFGGDASGSKCFLADLNDDGAPFSELADIIESEPPGLFVEATPTHP